MRFIHLECASPNYHLCNVYAHEQQTVNTECIQPKFNSFIAFLIYLSNAVTLKRNPVPSKAKHAKKQIVRLQKQFNMARIRFILECVLKNNIHWDEHVSWKNSHIVYQSRNNAWKNESLFIEMWQFGWVEYILWINSNKVVSEWTKLIQLGL